MRMWAVRSVPPSASSNVKRHDAHHEFVFVMALGTNADNIKNQGNAPNRELRPLENQEIEGSSASKEKLIRLDDLYSKQDVTSGHQLLFDATDTETNNDKGK